MKFRATQIYLSEEQHRAVQRRADALGVSMTEVIRELIDTHIVSPQPSFDFTELIGAVHSEEPTDITRDRDRMLMDALER